MKLVFYHISDLHIEKEMDTKSINIHKMVDVLNGQGKFDAIIIIVSGDIAYSGYHAQYDAAYKMFGTFIKLLKERFALTRVDMFVVPGNHDVDLTKDDGHKTIQEKLKAGITSEHIEKELKKQRAFYNYSKGIHCIDHQDPLCCIKTRTYGDKTLKFCLLNTALFSTLDEDKGLHYLTSDVVSKIKEELNADINITVMHHAHHWMHESIKNNIENVLIENNNIILCGHEHGLDTAEITKNGSKVIYLTGGQLCDRGDWDNSQFYLDIVDTENMSLCSISYIWNRYKKIYTNENTKEYELIDMSPIGSYELEEEFAEFLHNDSINSISDDVFDYYVFPDLKLIKENSDKEAEIVKDVDVFCQNILSQKLISIIGGENSGKTLLLKKIFLDLSAKDFTCVYCDAVDLKNASLKKIIPKIFRNNYKTINNNYDHFIQLPCSKRVLLLDNIHNIDKNQIFIVLKYLKDYFDIIIYSTKEIIELDMAERVRASAELGDFTRYKILPMYLKKRQDLISKIVDLKNDNGDNEELCNKIAISLKSQRKIYSMNPSFIIQFVDFYITNFKDAFATDGNVFSKVFENNIVNRIRPVAKKLTVDKILVLLDSVAYWCFKNQCSEIGQESISLIIKDYNDNFDDDVEYINFMSACLDSKLLRMSQYETKYRFVDKNVLSYFVAREIIRIWNDKLDDEDLNFLIKHVKYGINSNIILFVTYLTDNLYLIRNIIDGTIKYTESWNSFDLVNINIPYLATIQGLEIEAPSQKDRDMQEKKEVEQDRKDIEEYEDEQIVVKDFFDSKLDDCEKLINQIIRSITLLDIASKCLPGFEHRMNKADKEKVTNIIFSLPGKIFYIWAEQVEKDKPELLKYLLEEYRTVYLNPRDWDTVTEKDMLRYLQSESIFLLLELLNMPIKNSTKDYTIKYLVKYADYNEVLNELQILMAYGKMDMVQEFENMLGNIKDNKKGCIFEYMIKRVIYRYIITSKKISNEKIQRLISSYFPTSRPNNIYRNVLITRENNERKQ